jgi:hypothetical protein
MPLDLLSPHSSLDSLRSNYIHQLEQTINAYVSSYIFVGEALQNALDAIRMKSGGTKKVDVLLDFDNRRVTVRDTGLGFPDQPELLFLGGGKKQTLKLAGMVGVGLKVVLFSSCDFSIRARNEEKSLRVDIKDAYQFNASQPPIIALPQEDGLPIDPENYFSAGTGTEISYAFPVFPQEDEGVPERFLRDLLERCLKDSRTNYEKTLDNAVQRGGYPNRLAAFFASDLRRFSYVGATVDTPALSGLKISVSVVGSKKSFGPVAEYADGKYEFGFEVLPSYLTVEDTLKWAKTPKPVIRNDELGEGGTSLNRQDRAFNVLHFTENDEFKSLLVNARGNITADLERYERLLFNKLNCITLTIGRIPHFDEFLPGSSRRVISARGVITEHDIPIDSGRNQQYVRCFDLVMDVDADLNYGKTHLTDTHLVANVRRFANDAFAATISNAAQNLVGRIKTGDPTDAQFWSRPPLGVQKLSQTRVPYDENDVIALFFELTGMKHFQEFSSYGLSSVDPYDARAIIVIGNDDEKQRLRNNPSDTDLKVVEFKMRGASIARDFDRDEKDPDRVDLVICYEIGTSPVASFQVVDIDDSTLSRTGKHIAPGVTHVLYDTRTSREVPLLPLQTYVTKAFPPDEPADIPSEVVDAD